MKEGGASGAVINPGNPADSLLFEYVRDKKMPPKIPLRLAEVDLIRGWIQAGARWEGPALKAPMATAGRAGKDWWSLRPIRRPPTPRPVDSTWPRGPIDAFVLARLEARRLRPAPEADRRSYIRRVTVDLTGLLPTPAELEAFVGDRSPQAYENLVDRLLASPHFGERWGRHWLDVVRFAESHGYEMNTLRPNAWPYRDYIIRALNEDVPFPRFVREQLAGDVVGKGDPLVEAGTGFLVAGTHDMVGNATREGQLLQRMDDLYDMVSTTGSAFLGLTVNCARCHDHKFDPILQTDFYGLQAIFSGVVHGERVIRSQAPERSRSEIARLRARLTGLNRQIDDAEPLAGPRDARNRRPPVDPTRNVERFAPVTARYVRLVVNATTDGSEPCLDELEIWSHEAEPRNLALASLGARASASSEYPNNALHKIAHLNDGRYGNGHSWIGRERGKGWAVIELPTPASIDRAVWGRDREARFTDRLPSSYVIETSIDGKSWKAMAGSWDRRPYKSQSANSVPLPERMARLIAERTRLETSLADLEKPQAVYAGTFKQPEETFTLKRGDPLQPLEKVGPSGIRALGIPLGVDARSSDRERRLALARWIADVRNPLPPRVMVNRLWHYHFGQGLVRTPSDFGYNGDRPSHPELLDWLAAELHASGGRLKPIHKKIVLSATYRQSSRFDPDARKLDADCRLLWRYPPRRLEAEALRDAILQVSGALDFRMGGPGYNLWDYSGYVVSFKPKAKLGRAELRRMVYQLKPRTQQDETFGVFDCPDSTLTTPRRNVSTTPIQALNLLNGQFVNDQAERFAARLRNEAGAEHGDRVRRAFLLAFGREPTERETRAASRLAKEHGLSMLCRALFNANEFIYSN